MNYCKDSIIATLRSYNSISTAEQNVSEELFALERLISHISESIADSQSNDTSPSCENIQRLNALETQKNGLRARRLYLIAKRRSIERSLGKLSEVEKTALEKFFIDPPEEIGAADYLIEHIGYEKTQVYRIRDRALKKFADHFFGIPEFSNFKSCN